MSGNMKSLMGYEISGILVRNGPRAFDFWILNVKIFAIQAEILAGHGPKEKFTNIDGIFTL